MNKRKLYHWHKKLSIINAWYFLAIAIIFLIIGINGLRQNSLTTARLRQVVITADQQGGDSEKALRELRSFVFAHMNTDLSSGPTPIKPPIQLKGQYERLLAAEKERVKQKNVAVTAEAEAACASQFPSNGPNVARVTCAQDYIAQNATKERAIPGELYKFDFKSPAWSPDLAGISLLLSCAGFVLFALRLITERWLATRLR